MTPSFSIPPPLWLGELIERLEQARWRVLHRACDPNPESSDYWIGIERARTTTDLLLRTAHLLETKKWIQSTTWHTLISTARHELAVP